MVDFTEGIFIRELKNRFLCEVLIDTRLETCYVPSSCHLSNFIDLADKRVLLVPNKMTGSRTKFSLYAVPYKRNYIVLNTSMANRAVLSNIKSRRFSFLGSRKNISTECVRDKYKCDLFIEDTSTIVEVKSIISTQKEAVFPTVYSERSLNQLDCLYEYINSGNGAFYCIVSLHPYVDRVVIDDNTVFFAKLKRCLDSGMQIKAYTTRLKGKELIIDREVNVEV